MTLSPFPLGAAQTNGAQTNGAKLDIPQTWLKQTVQQFFNGVNWDNQPPEIQHLRWSSTQSSDASLSLMLTVNQFFNAINWEGNAAMPPQPITPTASASGEDDFTLDNFSDLF